MCTGMCTDMCIDMCAASHPRARTSCSNGGQHSASALPCVTRSTCTCTHAGTCLHAWRSRQPMFYGAHRAKTCCHVYSSGRHVNISDWRAWHCCAIFLHYSPNATTDWCPNGKPTRQTVGDMLPRSTLVSSPPMCGTAGLFYIRSGA